MDKATASPDTIVGSLLPPRIWRSRSGGHQLKYRSDAFSRPKAIMGNLLPPKRWL